MTVYYNEFDKKTAAWLRELIKQGLIADGDVDTRSIEDVKPNDLRGYVQCHFFAGIGGWPLALRLAGWPDDRPVWTGSCPCQPFSAAGKGNGFVDERHLWPYFDHLIAEREPATIFGEQVASSAVDAWIDLVHADLESLGYAFGSVPFPSAGVGAPHIRDRNYWVAHADSKLRNRRRNAGARGPIKHPNGSATGGVANTDIDRLQGCAEQTVFRTGGRHEGHASGCSSTSLAVGLADSNDDGQQARRTTTAAPRHGYSTDADGGNGRPRPTNGHWRDVDWLGCTDGKWRPVEPGTFPLAHEVSGRVGLLRGYGNAVNVEAAKIFIEETMMVIA